MPKSCRAAGLGGGESEANVICVARLNISASAVLSGWEGSGKECWLIVVIGERNADAAFG